MALGRLISKAVKETAKKATKKKGTLKPTNRGNKYTRNKDTGQVRSISKKTEERYDRMAEQKVKSDAKKAGKAAGASAAVVGAAAGAGVIAEKKQQNKKNEAAAKKRASERKASSTKPSSTKGVSQRDLKTIAKGVKQASDAQKKRNSGLKKDVAAAKSKRDANKIINSKTTQTKSYKIKSGDTLSAIAKANGTTVANLMKLNPQIKDKNKIYAGRSLKLPKK
jgi:LysM repeat protein